MNVNSIGRTMRWKLVLIYCLLVFIATTIIGVFIISQLETYYIDTTKKNITKTESTIITSLKSYKELDSHQQEIQTDIVAWKKTLLEDIFVVDENYMIIASTNGNKGQSAITVLDSKIIFPALDGKVSQSQGKIQESNIPILDMAFPIEQGKHITGVLYVRANMSSVYKNLAQSKLIFVKAMAIGLVITVLLGVFIARSITTPINDVTEKAEKMAQGDFSQEVSVKSNDEIGRLAEMFNLLRTQLDATLSEISSEKSKMETILQHMADGLIAVNLSGQIIHANPAALNMLRTTAAELNQRSYDSFIQELSNELTLEQLTKKCAEGELYEVFEKNGFTYATRYDWFKDENGNDVGIILLLQDITQRQKLENMQMDFVANVSHELKTPLTTIKSYTETLLDGYVDDPETLSNFLEIIDTEADRMNRLVKDLLQLSRLDNNQEILNRKEANLVSLIKAAVKKVEITANNKKQHLNCLFNLEERIPVDMDKDRIEQVILNILSNAIKYTKEGGRIDIDVLKVGKNAVVTITDNGMGIPESEQSRVFERFFRVDKARSRALGGTGLGLAISKQIVEAHQGTIELESKDGKGTKVTITLPLSLKKGIRNIE